MAADCVHSCKGLCTALSVAEHREEEALKEFLSSRGYPFHDPLYTFIFLPNDFLPEVRINRKGVVDIKKDEVLWPARRLD